MRVGFYLEKFSMLQIVFEVDKRLGKSETVFSSYAGVRGAVTLRNRQTDSRLTLPLAGIPDPSSVDGKFLRYEGWTSLASLSLGGYDIEGTVRDENKNATVLTRALPGVAHAVRLEYLGFRLLPGNLPVLSGRIVQKTELSIKSLTQEANISLRADAAVAVTLRSGHDGALRLQELTPK